MSRDDFRTPWMTCAQLRAVYARLATRVADYLGVPPHVAPECLQGSRICVQKALEVLLGGFLESELQELEQLPDAELIRAIEKHGRTGSVLFYRARIAEVLVQRISRQNASRASSSVAVLQAVREEVAQAIQAVPTIKLAVLSSLRAEDVAYALDCGGSWVNTRLRADSPKLEE